MIKDEQIISKKSKWKPNAPLGKGIPMEEYASRDKNIPRNILNASVMIKNEETVSSGTVVKCNVRNTQNRTNSCQHKHGRMRGEFFAVLTCLHAVGSARMAARTIIQRSRKKAKLAPEQFFYMDECLDLCICAINGDWDAYVHPRQFNVTWKHPEIAILHHPNAAPLTVTYGRMHSLLNMCMLHKVDTLHGSSGGGVYVVRGEQWYFIAVHCKALHIHETPVNSACLIQSIPASSMRFSFLKLQNEHGDDDYRSQ